MAKTTKDEQEKPQAGATKAAADKANDKANDKAGTAAEKPAEKARNAVLADAAAKTEKKTRKKKAKGKKSNGKAGKKDEKAVQKQDAAKKDEGSATKEVTDAAAKTAGPAKRETKQQTTSLFETMETAMTNGTFQFDKLAQEAQKSGQENFEALAQSGSVFAKGFEDMFKTYVSWAQQSAEKNSQAFKVLLGCKTLNELTEAQSQLARENFDDFLSGFTKLSELSVKVTTDAMEPINDQLSKSMKKAAQASAA